MDLPFLWNKEERTHIDCLALRCSPHPQTLFFLQDLGSLQMSLLVSRFCLSFFSLLPLLSPVLVGHTELPSAAQPARTHQSMTASQTKKRAAKMKLLRACQLRAGFLLQARSLAFCAAADRLRVQGTGGPASEGAYRPRRTNLFESSCVIKYLNGCSILHILFFLLGAYDK